MNAVNEFLRIHDRVIITGGSSGIGRSFIDVIGKINESSAICNLSRSNPDEFVGKLSRVHFSVDLTAPGWLEQVVPGIRKWLGEAGRGRILLINNSGFGAYGGFGEIPLESQLNMIDLNVKAVVGLTHALLPALWESGGHIINVASIAGRQPTPWLATYAATKSFVLHWSLALREECRRTGVGVTAVCPGPTESRFFERAGFRESPLKGFGHSAEFVVRRSLRAASRNRSMVVTGLVNRVMTAIGSKLPPGVQARIAAAVMRRMRLRSDHGGTEG